MLIEVKHYIQKYEMVTEQEVAQHFNLPLTLAHSLLSFWLDKGLIEAITSDQACGTCHGCNNNEQIRYRWIKQ